MESSNLEAIVLIRLQFRALVRNKNAHRIKCACTLNLKKENVPKFFLLLTKHPS
jgi:hypothetical protein